MMPKASCIFYDLPWICAPHLGQVMMIFPFPIGTRQMVPQVLQVKYLWSLSAWRALAPAFRLLTPHHQYQYLWFSVRRLGRFLENI